MSDKIEDKLRLLHAPFSPHDIEWRIQSSGERNGKIWARCLCYVTNRAIMQRLDKVMLPHNWKNSFEAAPQGGVMCGLSLRIDGEWITKFDAAENTAIEGVKGGFSDSMKRAAVHWGIGRYLYKLDAGFANISDAGKYSAKTKNGTWFKWDAPTLPAWALPKQENK